jgi:hypothetical protein
MALSPGVISVEKDLTFNIQSITSNAAGYVGLFNWGPAEQIVQITTNEGELAQRFGQPDSVTSPFFHAAANYLLYSVPLNVVRAIDPLATNAIASDASVANIDAPLVKNEAEYENGTFTGISFMGKYPGELGNSLKVSVANSAGFTSWTYASLFDYAPANTSTFNVVVIDEDGVLTGTAGSVVERYELMNLTEGSKKTDGTSAYLPEVLKNQSQFIVVGDQSAITLTSGTYEVSLVDGVDGNDIGTADFISCWDLFDDVDAVELVRVFTSFNPTNGIVRAIDVCDNRLDAVAFNAPTLSDVYNNPDRVTDIKAYFETTINKPSSYAFNVDNWKLVYDKYNDKNIWIPCDSDAAGLHARVFVQAEPWFSPAGLNRGQLKNVIKLAWSSNKAQRDVLYPSSINSIVAFAGEGTVLYGDKTALRAPSAFSRINVRTLFIVIKKAISRAARYQLFELNDFITQSLFRNATDRYLEDIKARRGIYDKRVVCDSTNNTPQVIDSNEFVGDILVKPARSINTIRLNFVAVGTGVSFEEIEGA